MSRFVKPLTADPQSPLQEHFSTNDIEIAINTELIPATSLAVQQQQTFDLNNQTYRTDQSSYLMRFH